MHSRSVQFCACLLAAACFAGCATPEARIRRNPELFASFPPDVQAAVRQGRIDIGYSQDMVRIALGPPARRYERATAAGSTEVWAYTATRYDHSYLPVDRSYLVRDAQGNVHRVSSLDHVGVEYRTEYEVLRVEFADGRVLAIDQLRPR